MITLSDLGTDLARTTTTLRGRPLEVRALSAYEWRRLTAQWPEKPERFVGPDGRQGPPDPDAPAENAERELGVRTCMVGIALGILAPDGSAWVPAAVGPDAKRWLRDYADAIQRALTIEEIAHVYSAVLVPLNAGRLTAEAVRGN